MYICITNVDTKTGIVCTKEPMKNGPAFPFLKGFLYDWCDESNYPISCTEEGVYTKAPKYYGICDDDAITSIEGVLEVMTKNDWDEAKKIEFEARKPYPSWVLKNNVWIPPFPRPNDAIINGGTVAYEWNEEVVNWTPL
jgi:hypothetical protein